MTSKLTREWLQHQISAIEAVGITDSNTLAAFKLALAAMDSEPYGYVHQSIYEQTGSSGLSNDHEAYHDSKNYIPLYRHAQQAPETEREPIAWLNDAYLARGVIDGEAGSEDAGPGYIPVYREASPVVQDARAITQYFDTLALETARGIMCDVNRRGDFLGGDIQLLSRIQCRIDDTCRAAMLQAGNSPAQIDASPESKRSREHFISLCNEFWNWSEMDLICADRGYEPRMEWDGTEFTHRVTKALWRMYQAAPGNSPVIPDGSEQRIAEAVELLKNAAPAMLSDDSGPNGPLVGRLKAQAVPGWIPVSERMPDETQPVIVVSEGSVVQRTIYQFCEGVWSDWYDLYDDVNIEAFTHWMPLPAAPQEVK